MDTRKTFVTVSTIFLLTLTLIGCGGSDPAETVLPSKTSTCGGQAITNTYLVHWRNGQISKVRYEDRELFKEEVVRPQLGEIQRIEYDQVFNVRDFAPRVISTKTSIDNWGYRTTHAAEAWAKGNYGAGVVVAVIDSGVDINHPLLGGQIAYNSGEAGALSNNGVDDDGNGYIDDYAGYNFLDGNNNVRDDVAHGTHVAGVIAANHSETTAPDGVVLGMAPKAKILPLKFIGPYGGTLSGAIEAMDYANKMGAKIINASWGGNGCSEILNQRVAEMGKNGVLFVTAAGNSGNNLEQFPEFPAAFRNPLQITVGSISTYGGMSDFSNYSRRYVHLFAPGFEITSTLPGGQIGAMSGTSMATPFVAGAAALLLSANPHLSVENLHAKVLDAILEDVTYPNITRGVLDLKTVAKSL